MSTFLKITPPNEYSSKQILIKSDRLVFNAFTSDILMGSKNTIALAANGEIHINSAGNLYLNVKQGSKIIIGKVDSKNRKTEQEAVLGNNLKNLLDDILQLLTTFQVITPSGEGQAGPDVAAKVSKLKTEYLKDPKKDTYILSDLLYIASNLKNKSTS